MYQVEIYYGLKDAHGKAFRRRIDKCGMPSAGDDLEKAKAEADRYSMWNPEAASYHQAATVADELPQWEQPNEKKEVYEKKYTVKPISEREEGQYVLVRVSKV